MQKNSDKFSMEDTLRLAENPAARQLMDLIQRSDSHQLQQAAALAAEGHIEQAQQLLSGLLEDPRVVQLLSQLGR